MFHVPGKYSGAAGAGFEWTQTRETIELTVPLADGAKGAVTFGPRQLTVFATDGTGAEPVLDGELHDVVVVDDCVWTRDDSPRQLAISLRKAVPAVWTRLLRSDIEYAQERSFSLTAPIHARARALCAAFCGSRVSTSLCLKHAVPRVP